MPARKAASLKLLTGATRADRLPKPTDPAALLTDAPPAPLHLGERAAAEWDRLAPATVGLGTLTHADLRALELLADTLATAAEAQAEVQRAGFTVPTADGGAKPHPAVRIMETARAQAKGLLADFGLTPRGRQGVDTKPAGIGVNPFSNNGRPPDPYAEFFPPR